MDEEEGWKMFLELCLKAKTTSRLNQLFALFLTLEEQANLSSRMEIIQALLKQHLTQREIATQLHVSIAQISRGSNALKIIDDDFKEFLKNTTKKLQDHEK